jgi:surface antigen
MKRALLVFCMMSLLAACAQAAPPQPKVTETPPVPLIPLPFEDKSGVTGPGGGALLGSLIGGGNVAKYSSIAGLAIGYAIHGSNGPTLTGMEAAEQRRAMARAMEAPLGTPVRWRTAADHASGEITPVRQFHDKERGLCRDYTETRIVRASHGQYTGTACLAG